MSRAVSVFHDRELVELLRNDPELLAIADALVVTQGPEYWTRRRAAAHRRRARWLVATAATLAAATALLLVSPWNHGPGVVESALGAIGTGPVLHVVVESPQLAGGPLVDIASGAPVARSLRTEIWFDGERDLKKTVFSIGGEVVDEQLETAAGGWSRSGRIYTCGWIQGHPVEATRAGVGCAPSRDAAGTQRRVTEEPPTVDVALAGFVDRYRSALADGTAVRAGTGQIGAKPVAWLAIETAGGRQRVAVDTSTFRPIRVETAKGAVSLHVSTAETLPFDPTIFTRPAQVPAQVGGAVSSETPISLADVTAELDGGVWLGRAWGDLRLVSVTRQERAVGSSAGDDERRVLTYELVYEPVAEDGGVAERPALRIYESRMCVVRLGWTCTLRDPMTDTTVGLPLGDFGPIALVRRGDVYVSIWRADDSLAPRLLDVAQALVEARSPTGIDGSSSYSNWQSNDFSKSTSGVSDTMVTLIDNVSYSWHGTVRNMNSHQHAFWGWEGTSRKGYCKYYAGTNFNGSCWVD